MARHWPCALVLLSALAGCQTAGVATHDPIAYAPAKDGTVGLIGSAIGVDLAEADRNIGLDAEYRALEYGESGVGVDWQGQNGVAGAVVPGPRYRVNDTDCRQFTHTVTIHGMVQAATGTACRGTDGAWRIIA